MQADQYFYTYWMLEGLDEMAISTALEINGQRTRCQTAGSVIETPNSGEPL